jgi:MoaA/NifB/PqqE/SkfB family radical SAM enzyme
MSKDVKESQIDLPISVISELCDKINSAGWRIYYAYPFMNSDPTCDQQLPEVIKLLKKKLKSHTLVSTNGVLYSRRHLLRDRNLNSVQFTFSAATPKLYEKVHGKPLYSEALKTINWLLKNKYWHQHVGVRYIAYKGNLHELPTWSRMFKDLQREVRPLHFSPDRQTSDQLKDVEQPIMKMLYTRQQEHYRRNELPCGCFHNLSISYKGEVMQCCDLPYKYNWGHVSEVDLEEVRHKRLELGLNHEGCKTCNQKYAHWEQLFEKYVWN